MFRASCCVLARTRAPKGDLTYPVASFVKELLETHPEIRSAKFGTRLDLVKALWDRLPVHKKQIYAADPLKGLRPEKKTKQ